MDIAEHIKIGTLSFQAASAIQVYLQPNEQSRNTFYSAGSLLYEGLPVYGETMISLAPNLYYLRGKNRSRFPYCACLFVTGRDRHILIDAGMGGSLIKPVKEMGVDLLVLTHCHVDHRLTRREIPEVPVWCHENEKPYMCDRDQFAVGTGLVRSGLKFSRLPARDQNIFKMNIEHTPADGERIDLGGITLETILTPGHSPGHLSFYIPEHGVLFSGDVDLTPFGPFYGHDFADLGDFIDSIDRLRRLDARTVVTGHSGPFTENLKKRFDQYEAVIYEREREILKYLDQPRPLEFFHGRNIVYRKYYEKDPYIDLTKWVELVHVEKHLQYLVKTGRVMQDPDSKMWLK